MQNSECTMHNYGMPFGHDLKSVREADTTILHFAFCILHFSIIHGKSLIFKKILCVHILPAYSLQFVHPDMSFFGIIR